MEQVEGSETEYKVSCEIVNNGKYDGAEIVQLYVKAPQGVFKPIRELKGFTKVYLKAGESKRAEIVINKDDLRYFNVKKNGWGFERGEYELQLCSDCQSVRLSHTVALKGDNAVMPYDAIILDEAQDIPSCLFAKNRFYERKCNIYILST